MICENCRMPLLEGEDVKDSANYKTHRNELTCIRNLKRAYLYLVATIAALKKGEIQESQPVYNVPYKDGGNI